MSVVGPSGTVCDDPCRNRTFVLLSVIVRSKKVPDISSDVPFVFFPGGITASLRDVADPNFSPGRSPCRALSPPVPRAGFLLPGATSLRVVAGPGQRLKCLCFTTCNCPLEGCPGHFIDARRGPTRNCLRRPLSKSHVCLATCNCPLEECSGHLADVSRGPVKNCLRRPLSKPHVCLATWNCPLEECPGQIK